MPPESAGAPGPLVAFRLAAWDTPLWVLPNRRASRFNRPGDPPTQYLALHPLTPWAELLRFEGRTTEAEGDELRPPLWALRVDLDPDRVVELTFATAAEFGLAPADLVGDDHGPCQALAAALRARAEPPDALIAPSAALPGTRNLVLFGPRVAFPYEATPVDRVDVPAALAAVEGRAPYGLAGGVHHRGARTRHAGLEAWERGEELRLASGSIERSPA